MLIIGRVTSGEFGHIFANSGNPEETAPYESSHLDFHCLLSYFSILMIKIRNKQGRCPNLPDVRSYLTLTSQWSWW